MSDITDLAAGKAGEYLVCADITLQGHVAFPSEQGLPYDVVADIAGQLLRVQVKTTRGLRVIPQRKELSSGYLFHVGRCGKSGVKSYEANDVDLFAMVALDTRTIGYLRADSVRRTMIFRAPQNGGLHHDEIMETRRLHVVADKASGMRNFEIAEKHDMDRSVVTRTLRSGKSKQRRSPYLNELTLDRLVAANDNNVTARQSA